MVSMVAPPLLPYTAKVGSHKVVLINGGRAVAIPS